MDNLFIGQKYLITGGASGIGLATARLLKSNGTALMLWDVNADALANAGRELSAQTCVVDVTDAGQVAEAMAQTVNTLGGLNGVIHSAGILRTGVFAGSNIAEQIRMVSVNLTGTLTVAYAALPHLKETRGALVLLGSVSAFYGGPEFATYGATKAAVLNFAQALRIELADTEIYIGVVSPHFVSTPMLDDRNRKARFVSNKSPFVEMGTAEQVARAIVNGIQARRFMIWTGWRGWLIFVLSRYADFFSGRMMAQTWRS